MPGPKNLMQQQPQPQPQPQQSAQMFGINQPGENQRFSHPTQPQQPTAARIIGGNIYDNQFNNQQSQQQQQSQQRLSQCGNLINSLSTTTTTNTNELYLMANQQLPPPSSHQPSQSQSQPQPHQLNNLFGQMDNNNNVGFNVQPNQSQAMGTYSNVNQSIVNGENNFHLINKQQPQSQSNQITINQQQTSNQYGKTNQLMDQQHQHQQQQQYGVQGINQSAIRHSMGEHQHQLNAQQSQYVFGNINKQQASLSNVYGSMNIGSGQQLGGQQQQQQPLPAASMISNQSNKQQYLINNTNTNANINTNTNTNANTMQRMVTQYKQPTTSMNQTLTVTSGRNYHPHSSQHIVDSNWPGHVTELSPIMDVSPSLEAAEAQEILERRRSTVSTYFETIFDNSI